MTKRKPKNNPILFAGAAVVLALVAVVVSLGPIPVPVYGIIRTAAVLGYFSCYLAVLSSLFIKELVKKFGRSFVKVHHIASITSLAAIISHAIFAATFYFKSFSVFIPSPDTPQALAFWLMMFAALAAILRKVIGKNWKIAHWLNYVVLLMATLHANTIGTNFQNLPLTIISVAMALSVVVIFVLKRQPKRKKKG